MYYYIKQVNGVRCSRSCQPGGTGCWFSFFVFSVFEGSPTLFVVFKMLIYNCCGSGGVYLNQQEYAVQLVGMWCEDGADMIGQPDRELTVNKDENEAWVTVAIMPILWMFHFDVPI